MSVESTVRKDEFIGLKVRVDSWRVGYKDAGKRPEERQTLVEHLAFAGTGVGLAVPLCRKWEEWVSESLISLEPFGGISFPLL